MNVMYNPDHKGHKHYLRQTNLVSRFLGGVDVTMVTSRVINKQSYQQASDLHVDHSISCKKITTRLVPTLAW